MTTLTTLRTEARKAALKTKAGRPITGETIRMRCEAAGVTTERPALWGGIIQGLVNSGVLTRTNETTVMTSPKARGRRSPVYIRQSTTSPLHA